MYELKYLLDGEPISAHGLIKTATEYDDNFKNDWYRSTSKAAEILRNNNYEVCNNPDYKENK